MTSLSGVKQAEIIEAFKPTSRYLDELLNIDNPYFEGMVNRIYPPELQLNKANTSDTEAPFLDLHLSISNGFVSSKIYDKRDVFDFIIENFPFLDGDVPRSTSYGVYISQLIRFCMLFFFFFFFILPPSLIARRWVGRQTQLWPRHKAIFVYCLAHRGSTVGFLLLQCSSGVVRHPMDLQVSVATRFCRVLIFASSQYLSVFYLFHVMIHWWVRKPSRGPNNCMFCAMIEAEGEVGYP